jgi:hypothetical protein
MNPPDNTLSTLLLGMLVVIPLEVVAIFLFWIPYHLIVRYRRRPDRAWIARA